MANPSDEWEKRAVRYATARKIQLKHSLGFGKDGAVYSASTGNAIKVFGATDPYINERNCYMRLAERGVDNVLGFSIPEMIAWSDKLLVIEMSMVRPPYILDFASARLDQAPEFSDEVLEQWTQDRVEEFGGRWAKVVVMMEILKQECGIYLTDVHPRNIAFGQEPRDDSAGSP